LALHFNSLIVRLDYSSAEFMGFISVTKEHYMVTANCVNVATTAQAFTNVFGITAAIPSFDPLHIFTIHKILRELNSTSTTLQIRPE
jgi:hypothetical protein